MATFPVGSSVLSQDNRVEVPRVCRPEDISEDAVRPRCFRT